MLELTRALSSSLDLTEVLARAQEILTQLLPCDSAALCVSRPERPGDYEWMGLGAPNILFAHYPELATVDFVRATSPLASKELKRNLLYLSCREMMGLPL